MSGRLQRAQRDPLYARTHRGRVGRALTERVVARTLRRMYGSLVKRRKELCADRTAANTRAREPRQANTQSGESR